MSKQNVILLGNQCTYKKSWKITCDLIINTDYQFGLRAGSKGEITHRMHKSKLKKSVTITA